MCVYPKAVIRSALSNAVPTLHGDLRNLFCRGEKGEAATVTIAGLQTSLDKEKSISAEALAKVAGTKMLADGYICLQSESHPVQFRKVELRPLKD